ncbi:hypothetical protein TB2_023036 [Malus domestica]
MGVWGGWCKEEKGERKREGVRKGGRRAKSRNAESTAAVSLRGSATVRRTARDILQTSLVEEATSINDAASFKSRVLGKTPNFRIRYVTDEETKTLEVRRNLRQRF